MSDPVESAKHVIEQLKDGEYAAIFETFDDEMKAGFPVEVLRQTWDQLTTQVGAFKQVADALRKDHEDLNVVFVKADFERARMIMRVVYRANGRLAGLAFKQAD